MRFASMIALGAALSATAASAIHAAPTPQTVAITVQNFDYSPMAAVVAKGGAVTWKNLDEEPHTVTSVDGAFHSGALDEGQSFTFRFTKPGVYKYVCSIHPQMVATVTVK
jgi:plastocyanin